MSENWVTKTIDKISAARHDFFWDACVALQVNQITGDYVEFGSWGGHSLSCAYEAISAIGSDRHLWAYDSFEGLPEVTDPRDERWRSDHSFEVGGIEAFHAACAEFGVPRDAYTAVEGYFSDTLGSLGPDDPPNDIAFAYVDCNMYSSTVTVFDFLAPRLKHGMIVAFDDYWLWSPTEVSGERSALDEFLTANPQWHFERYQSIGYAALSFVVERADLTHRR
jgi:hypothetical protein